MNEDKDFDEQIFRVIPRLKNFLFLRFLAFFSNILFYSFLGFRSKNYFINKERKIAINYNFDLDSPYSNNWWLKDININKRNIIFYFSEFGKAKANDEIINKIKSKGYSYKILNKKLNNTSNMKTESLYLKYESIIFIIKNLILILYNFRRFDKFNWQLKKWLQIIVKVNLYKTFIQNNNIQIILDNTEMSVDIIALSSSAAKIKKVYYQRSEIFFPISYFRPMHDYFFLWGKTAKKIFLEYLKNQYTKFIIVGNMIEGFPLKEAIREYVNMNYKNFFKEKDKIFISVFDRSSGINSWLESEYHKKFYDGIISLAERNDNVRLIVKPKSKINCNILKYKNLKIRLNSLIEKNKLIILNSSYSVLHAALLSKISFSLGINSAGVQSSVGGVYPFFWDPLCFEKSCYSELASHAGYEESFNVSSDLELLISNLESIISNASNLDKLRLNHDFIVNRNFFNDNKSLKRMTENIENIFYH